MTVGLVHLMFLGTLLFMIGAYGVLTKKNLISILMAVEIMLNGVNINLVAAWRYGASSAPTGQLWALIIMVVAAAEVAVGLALIYAVYKRSREVELEKFDLLKW